MACITLLSDFGLNDISVAAARGILMQHTQSPIIDISHEITPFNMKQAAYLLSGAYRKFPEGTCHLVLFDLYSRPDPQMILIAYEGQYFLSADNGLLPMTLTDHTGEGWLCYRLKKTDSFIDWMNAAGKTINSLSSNGRPDTLLTPYELKQNTVVPASPAGILSCDVIHIDRYENVVTDITHRQFHEAAGNRRFRIELMEMEEITEISKDYSDVKEGNKLCRFNSNNHLEICINRGKAASLFGLRLNSKQNNIKIYFE